MRETLYPIRGNLIHADDDEPSIHSDITMDTTVLSEAPSKPSDESMRSGLSCIGESDNKFQAFGIYRQQKSQPLSSAHRRPISDASPTVPQRPLSMYPGKDSLPSIADKSPAMPDRRPWGASFVNEDGTALLSESFLDLESSLFSNEPASKTKAPKERARKSNESKNKKRGSTKPGRKRTDSRNDEKQKRRGRGDSVLSPGKKGDDASRTPEKKTNCKPASLSSKDRRSSDESAKALKSPKRNESCNGEEKKRRGSGDSHGSSRVPDRVKRQSKTQNLLLKMYSSRGIMLAQHESSTATRRRPKINITKEARIPRTRNPRIGRSKSPYSNLGMITQENSPDITGRRKTRGYSNDDGNTVVLHGEAHPTTAQRRSTIDNCMHSTPSVMKDAIQRRRSGNMNAVIRDERSKTPESSPGSSTRRRKEHRSSIENRKRRSTRRSPQMDNSSHSTPAMLNDTLQRRTRDMAAESDNFSPTSGTSRRRARKLRHNSIEKNRWEESLPGLRSKSIDNSMLSYSIHSSPEELLGLVEKNKNDIQRKDTDNPGTLGRRVRRGRRSDADIEDDLQASIRRSGSKAKRRMAENKCVKSTNQNDLVPPRRLLRRQSLNSGTHYLQLTHTYDGDSNMVLMISDSRSPKEERCSVTKA